MDSWTLKYPPPWEVYEQVESSFGHGPNTNEQRRLAGQEG